MNQNDQNNIVRKLFEVCGGLQRQLHEQHHQHRGGGTIESPHRGQGRVLMLLKLKPRTTQKELSFLLDMRPQSLGELLGKMEKNGLVVRKPSEWDRRVMEVELTEKGIKQAEHVEKMSERSTGVLDCLTEEEQKNLECYMDKLLDHMGYGDQPDPREGFFGRLRPGQQTPPRPPRQSPRSARWSDRGIPGTADWPGDGSEMF